MTTCTCRRCGRSPSPTAWFTQNGWASVVDSTADFNPNFHPLSGYNWKWWLSRQVFAHEAFAFITQNLTRWKPRVLKEKLTPFGEIFKINVQKLADICGYELPTNLKNFTQKDLTEVKIFWKVLGGYFFETFCRHRWRVCRPSQAGIIGSN